MRRRRVVLTTTFMVILAVVSSCKSFDSSLDPASEKYIPPAFGLIINDFESGPPPDANCPIPDTLLSTNLVGGYPFQDPEPKRSSVAEINLCYTNTKEHTLRGVGYSLQVDFRISEPDTSAGYGENLFNEEKISFNYFPARSLKLDIFSFWIKSDVENLTVSCGFFDTTSQEQYVQKKIGSEWMQVDLKLHDFDSIELDSLESVFIKVDGEFVGIAEGVFYLDELAFR